MTTSAKLQCCLAAVCLLTPLLSAAEDWDAGKHDRYVSFEVPHSQATYPLSINEARTVTGYYIDQAGVTRGFVRRDDGDLTTFSIPGGVFTKPIAINTAGDITGYYEVASSTDLLSQVPQGFIRSANGQTTTFGNTISTSSSASFWPQPVAINVAGEVVGNFPFFTFSSFVFIRSASGSVETFSLSDGAEYSTVITGLNAAGVIVGYSSSTLISQAAGFLWDGQGPPPNPINNTGVVGVNVSGSTGTFPTAINAEQSVVGCYSNNGVFYDFLRSPDGDIQTLDVPGTVPVCTAQVNTGIYDVNPASVTINDQGTIAGWYTDAQKISRGFLRSEDGKLRTFAHHGSAQTIPTSINNCDVITGYYSRGNKIVGFLREP